MDKDYLLKNSIDEAFYYIKNKLFSEKTGLIYDHVLSGRESEFPSADEIEELFPNPGGYSTGMEDGMLSGATMLDASLLKYKKEGDFAAAEFACKLARGMLNCAFSAKSEGFIPRAVSVKDGKSYYPDSSRDQYTMFGFAMHRYLLSGLCSSDEKDKIAKAAVAVAKRCERNVVPENSYDMLRDDGKPTLVTTMWGDSLNNHEYLRLPMLYILAYEASSNVHWFKKYQEIRSEAYLKSLPMGEYWAFYSLQQMQASILVCYEAEIDNEWKEKYLSLMNIVADYAENMVDLKLERIESMSNFNAPQTDFRKLEMKSGAHLKEGYENALLPQRPDSDEYFALQDCAQANIVAGLVPERKPNESTAAVCEKAFSKIDLSKHERNLPVYFYDAYYRCK